MEENVKPKTTTRVKEKRPPHNHETLPKRIKHQGLIKTDLSQLSPPKSYDPGSPVKKLFSEANKIVKLGMEKEYVLLERDTTLQNSNETIDNLRKNMLHLQMEYEKLDQNFQKEISYRTEIVKRMEATRELVESVVQCSNVLATSTKQLEEDKLKIAEFYELIYQNQKEVEGKHERIEKFLKEQDTVLNSKFGEMRNFQEKVLPQHAEIVSQLNKRVTNAIEKLKIAEQDTEKLKKKLQECEDSSNRLRSCLEQQEKLNQLQEETVVQFKRNLKIFKIQRFKTQKQLKNKKEQLSALIVRNKNLKKSLGNVEDLYRECLSTNKILKSKNEEWKTEFKKHFDQYTAERESWETEKKDLINKLTTRESEIEDLKTENKNLTHKILDLTTREEARVLELDNIENQLSKMLNENLKLKEKVEKLGEDNNDKAKIISMMEEKSVAVGSDLNSQIEFHKNESRRLENLVKKLEGQLLEVQEALTCERTEYENRTFEVSTKFEENSKTLQERIYGLEKLLEAKASHIQKLESEKNYAILNGKTELENLDKQLQMEKLKNQEVNNHLEKIITAREDANKQLKEATNQISNNIEKMEELKSLNKTLQDTHINMEKRVEDFKKEVEIGKKSFGDLEERYKRAERELNKLQKVAEENSALKSSNGELKKHLEATEARLEAYKVVVKKLESEKVQAKNNYSEEISKLKLELSRLEEAKENRRLETGSTERGHDDNPSQNLNTKENDPEAEKENEKWQQVSTPVQSSKKFLSTPRKILTSTPSFGRLTPIQKKRDPYDFDSDSSVEQFDPDKVLKVFNRQKKERNKRTKTNK